MAAVEATAGYTVARRCADLADLLAAAAAGHGDIALVSADLRALDRPALHELASHGVEAAGVVGARRRAGGAAAAPARPGRRPARRPGQPRDRRRARRARGDPRRRAAPARPAPAGAAGAGGAGPAPRGRRPPVIAVWGPTGAPGRTTVALNLAAELALRRPTLLVDLDTYGASIAQALGLLDEAPGVAAAARAADQGALDLPAWPGWRRRSSPGCGCSPAYPRAERWTELRAASVAHVLATARGWRASSSWTAGSRSRTTRSCPTTRWRRAATPRPSPPSRWPTSSSWSAPADPIGLQRLVRAVQDLAAVPSPRHGWWSTGSAPPRWVRDPSAGSPRPWPASPGMDDLAFLPTTRPPSTARCSPGTTLAEFAPQSELRRAVALARGAYAGRPRAPRAVRGRIAAQELNSRVRPPTV